MQQRPVTPQHIENSKPPEQKCGGQNEEYPGNDPSPDPMETPADPGCKLLGLGPGQKHAELKRTDKLGLPDPLPTLHHLAMQDRDLTGRSAETDAADLQPEAHGFCKTRRLFLRGIHWKKISRRAEVPPSDRRARRPSGGFRQGQAVLRR